MNTKYARQQLSARKTILKKGTFCTWLKNTDSLDVANPPEMANSGEPTKYDKTPIVFYPQENNRLLTETFVPVTNTPSNQLYAIIPGDVPFIPEEGDAVIVGIDTLHVDTLNVTKPDYVPIIWEIAFK